MIVTIKEVQKKLVSKKIRPVRSDGLFILEDSQDETVSSGGIIVPVKSNSVLRRATVVSVGKGISELKQGDRVLFDRAYGNVVSHEDDSVFRLLYVTLNQLECEIIDDNKIQV